MKEPETRIMGDLEELQHNLAALARFLLKREEQSETEVKNRQHEGRGICD